MADVIAVRGHLCDGLRRHFEAAEYGCIPRLTEGGAIAGCDDTNPVPVDFCPWCGADLRQNPTAAASGTGRAE